jgi:acyl carrier protein
MVCAANYEKGFKMIIEELEVKKLIAKQFGLKVEDVKNESSFIKDLGGDSLDTVELVLEFEDHYGVEVPEAVAENIFTVQDVIDFLKSV